VKPLRATAALLAALTAGAATVPGGPASDEATAPGSPVAGGPGVPLSLSIHTSRTVYLLGEPVQVYLLYRNLTDEEFILRGNYFLDRDLSIEITDEEGQRRRFVDRIRTGITVPNRARIRPGGTRGFFETIAYSDTGDGGLPFPRPGLYRIDATSTVQIEGSPVRDVLLADPVTIRVSEPTEESDRAVHEIFLLPEVANSVQRKYATTDVEDALERVIELAPESRFAEHAHLLLATIEMEHQLWLRANEHLYAVYERRGSHYAKDLILLGIFANFHWAEEPERALIVLKILLELFPHQRDAGNPLVDSYIQQFIEPVLPE
jgi:hypothetical protein